MRRTASGGGRGSALSIRRDTNPLRPDSTTPGTPVATSAGRSAFSRPHVSRNSSANTAVNIQRLQGATPGPASPRPGQGPARPGSPPRTRLSSLPITADSVNESEPLSPGPASSDDGSSSSSDSPHKSRIFPRPPRYSESNNPFDDESEDSQPAFMPPKPRPQQADGGSSQRDMSATLRGDPRAGARRQVKPKPNQSQTSDSSASSSAYPSKFTRDPPTGPLSPRRTAELSGRAVSKGKGASREGSDGTPSMGSSFSDLDGTSCLLSHVERDALIRTYRHIHHSICT